MASEPSLRTAAVGMSVSPTCGVRAHATVLAGALAEDGIACELHWLSREERSLASARGQVRAWTRALRAELPRSELDAVLLHYSVFAFSYRGVPVFVHPTLSALRDSRLPVISILHELAYPWDLGGARGKVWAASQRALLIEVMRRSSAVLVTADFRARWLETRAWLPRRPIAVAPVFSNLPPPSEPAHTHRDGRRIGLFGYAYEGVPMALVLDALRLLRDGGGEGGDARLVLLGAPGEGSAEAAAWRRGARERGLAGALELSGTLAAQPLSDALAACDVLLFVGRHGPSSRKGTLAASLASGSPVVALDGPRGWSEAIERGALRVVAQRPDALAAELAGLLADEPARAALGARGRAFAEERMSAARTAHEVSALLARVGVSAPARS